MGNGLQIVLIGAAISEGVGKESGRPFKFGVLRALVPAQSGQFGTMTRTASGFEMGEIAATDEIVARIAALPKERFPLGGFADFDQRIRDGKLGLVVSGFTANQPQSAPAPAAARA